MREILNPLTAEEKAAQVAELDEVLEKLRAAIAAMADATRPLYWLPIEVGFRNTVHGQWDAAVTNVIHTTKQVLVMHAELEAPELVDAMNREISTDWYEAMERARRYQH